MSKRVLVILFSMTCIALLFWYSDSLQNQFYVIVDFFNALVLQHELLAVLVFILSATVGALISPFTNLPLVPFAVVIWGTTSTTIFLLIGWIIGDVIAYFIGRHLGRRVVLSFVDAKKLDDISRVVKKRTNFLTALVVRLALPAELGYAFGLVRYHFGAYLLVTFIAELPFAIISANASEAIIFGEVQEFFGAIILLLLIIIVAFIKIRSIKAKSH